MKSDQKVTVSIGKKQIALILLLLIAVSGVLASYPVDLKKWVVPEVEPAFAAPESIEDVYPLFMCPCCGMPLDPDQPCCGQAVERINYISALHDGGLSNDEIILTTVKKYGVNLLLDEEMKKGVQTELERRAPLDRPIIEVSPVKLDLGEVSVKKGIVTTSFRVENRGESNLVIDNIETSCMCTTADLTVNGIESPVFGMNMKDGKHPTGWSVAISPGAEGNLEVSYDPQMHSDMRGPLTRTISLYSNDPVVFKKEVHITAVQVD